jgi:hypothetical protein
MKKLNKKSKEILATGLTFISRFSLLPANFSPLGSLGFFGQNAALYFGSILLFDLVRGGFYSGFIFNYLAFAGYYFLGKIAKTEKQQLALLPIASLLFFLISNFGVWLNWYPHNLTGLFDCYTLALPFYQNTLMGDLFFGYGFLAIKKIVKTKLTKVEIA